MRSCVIYLGNISHALSVLIEWVNIIVNNKSGGEMESKSKIGKNSGRTKQNKKHVYVPIFDAERGTGEATLLAGELRRAGFKARTGHSPFVGYVAVLVDFDKLSELTQMKRIAKDCSMNIDIDTVKSNLERRESDPDIIW